MPINQTIWQINKGEKPKEVKFITLKSEQDLEDIIQARVEILNSNWLVIGRQIPTDFNKYIDLLAIDSNGSIIVIELKKDKTPRDVVAQGIDYASWIKKLTLDKIVEIYENFNQKYLKNEGNLENAFYNKFTVKLDGEIVNSSHQIVVVAADTDTSTERIISYLNEFNVPVNIAFFRVFEIEGQKFISRVWFIDPYETEENAVSRGKNLFIGEYYCSFGDGDERSWEDAVKYGFISGGGGSSSNPGWYSKTLNMLSVGDRIWVNIPGKGYVGVGRVEATAKKASEVILSDGKNIYDLANKAGYHKNFTNDEDRAEYMIKVQWIKTVEKAKAVKELGFFGNQNTVCAPTADSWSHTVERLKEIWDIK